MTLTIHEGHNKLYIIVATRNEAFRDYPLASLRGNGYYCTDIQTRDVYRELRDIAAWVNNELGDACCFEID